MQRLHDPTLLTEPIFGDEALGEGSFVDTPAHEAGHARRGDEQAVDARPGPRIADRSTVVEDRLGLEHAHDAVMQQHERDGAEERQPVLVEGYDCHHHEEVEVHLDDTTGQVDENP